MAATFGQGPVMPAVATLPSAAANPYRMLVQDGTIWFSNGSAWIDLGGGGGVPEAPTDGKYYARRNSAWEEVTNPGVITITATATLDSSHLNKVISFTGTTGTLTIPSGLGSSGDMITIMHNAASGYLTVAGGGGVSIYRGSYASSQSLPKYSMMTFVRSSVSNTWIAG